MVCCVQTVNQDDLAVITTCGKFDHVQQPGLFCMIAPIQSRAGEVSTRVQSLDLTVNCKTKDSVFVDLALRVQFILDKSDGGVYKAFYVLVNTQYQLKMYVMDVMRSVVSTMELDECFENKDRITSEVKQSLGKKMEGFGYMVTQVLIVDVVPDQGVRDAMNEINKSRRDKEALVNKMAAQKVLIIKQAEAEAESMKLSGGGVARQRTAILKGFQESVEAFSEGAAESGGKDQMRMKDVLELILCTQYFDTLKEMGTASGKSSCIFLHTGSDSGANGMRNALLSARHA